MKCYAIKKKGENLYWYHHVFLPFPENIRDLYLFVAYDEPFLAEKDIEKNSLIGCEIVEVNIPEPEAQIPKRHIVCLCGSTKFYEEFQKANYEETMKGNIVLSVGFYPHNSQIAHGEKIEITENQKSALDVLHFEKIKMSDEVFILNKNGYIGESTCRELNFAKQLGKKIKYLEKIIPKEPEES